MDKLSERLSALAEKANSTDLMPLVERYHAKLELLELLSAALPTIISALQEKDL